MNDLGKYVFKNFLESTINSFDARIGTLEKERADLLSRIATLEARMNDQKEKIRDVENELKHTFGIAARIQGQFDAYTLFQQQIKRLDNDKDKG